MGLSPELTHEIARLKGMHKFNIPEEEQKVFINISFDVNNGSADELVKKIGEVV